MNVIVFGGYGVFGSLVSRELARLCLRVTVAGRDATRASTFAASLGEGHRGTRADVTKLESCREALAGQRVAVSCAGPFDSLGKTLLEACLDQGVHYADIADDRSYAALVRSHSDRFREKDLAAAWGCSSLPGISGALALAAREGSNAKLKHLRVTLFIGNDNPKGEAAVASAVGLIGKPFPAPQGTLIGFRDPEVVELPAPFGRRTVYNFESPEYDILAGLIGTPSVSVKVGFEVRMATATFGMLARLSTGYGARTAQILKVVGGVGRSLGGHSGGAVMSELFFEDGTTRRASISSASEAQRMAALPCALVVNALCRGEAKARGAVTAFELLGGKQLLEGLTKEGFQLA